MPATPFQYLTSVALYPGCQPAAMQEANRAWTFENSIKIARVSSNTGFSWRCASRYPPNYIPDRYFHLASQREDLSWMIQAQELYEEMIRKWLQNQH